MQFVFISDGYLVVSSEIDYESITSKTFEINITATDGKGSAKNVISLTILDQNEAPVFYLREYSVEMNESKVCIRSDNVNIFN